MPAQDAGLAHAQQVAPLPGKRVEHQRPEPDVRRLRHPDAFVFRNGGGDDLIGRQRMSGLLTYSGCGVAAIDRQNGAGDERGGLRAQE